MARKINRLNASNLPMEVGDHADGDGLYLQIRKGSGERLSQSWIFRSKVGGREGELGLGPLERGEPRGSP